MRRQNYEKKITCANLFYFFTKKAENLQRNFGIRSNE